MAPRIVFGAGTVRTALATELDQLGARRVMLIATERELARQSDVLAALDHVVVTFSDGRAHVPVDVADSARRAADAAEADALLAIGGGSAIGTAKAVALTSGRPIVAVPTTYAGSEMTAVWGLTDETGKHTGVDPRVVARVVIYDPDLTATLPIGESMASGVNALAHAIDALWAPKINPDLTVRASDAIAVAVVGLDALHTTAPDPTPDAREKMLRGAMLAGQVFAAAGSGLHHKICHVLGGRYNLPHAQTHAVVLPHVVRFNAPAAPDALSRIAGGLGVGGLGASGLGAGGLGVSRPGVADGVGALFERLREWGVPTKLSDLGFDRALIPDAADAILPNVPAANPRTVTRADLIDLLSDAYDGGAR
ncbi:MAG TPA: maleylacetate reductase [Nakamurella sp.]